MSEPDSQLPNLNKETFEFISEIEAQNGPPLYMLSPKEAREFLLNLQNKTHKEIPSFIEDLEIETKEGKVGIRIFRPENNNDKLPAIIYLHGGGWVIGDFQTHDMLCRKLSNSTNSAVVFVKFSPSPEARYPKAINEIWEVLNEIAKNPLKYNIDKDKIAIAGDSAGANMAAVTALRTKLESGPKIIFQVLFYPVTNSDMDTQSYECFKDGPWLSKKAMEWFWDQYLADKTKRHNIYASPLQASFDQLSGVAPALVITDENDVLRDEGEAYARKLDEAGVNVLNVRINGTHHDFLMLNALIETECAKGALELTYSILNKVFMS